MTAAPKRPRAKAVSEAIRAYQYGDSKDIDVQLYPKYGQEDVVFINDDAMCIVETDDERFFLFSNHSDPENPVSVPEIAERLVEVLASGQEPETGPRSYYGVYMPTLEAAIAEARRWLTIPVKDWPKEYNRPIMLDG